ncbi:MAG: hypothetical protein LBT45_00290 [Rickettsiales bacterium]|nr:hypothetical protein [Rickettsiales bacterium]
MAESVTEIELLSNMKQLRDVPKGHRGELWAMNKEIIAGVLRQFKRIGRQRGQQEQR